MLNSLNVVYPLKGERARFQYQLEKAGFVKISVVNPDGKTVRVLVKGKQAPGIKDVDWDVTNELGDMVSSGYYFVQLETPRQKAIQKITIIR